MEREASSTSIPKQIFGRSAMKATSNMEKNGASEWRETMTASIAESFQKAAGPEKVVCKTRKETFLMEYSRKGS